MEISPDHKELPEEQTRVREEGKHSSAAKRQPKDPGPRVLGHGDKHPELTASTPLTSQMVAGARAMFVEEVSGV